MSTQFSFRATSVTTSMPTADNFVGTNSGLTITTPPSVDTISDAINNVRFACTGFAGHGGFETVLFTLNTRHTFRFQPVGTGRLTAHAHFTPQGGFSLVGRKPASWFDGPGTASLGIFFRMRVRVLAANGTIPLNVLTPSRRLAGFSAKGSNVSDTEEGAIDATLLQFSANRAFETLVTPADTVEVQARYTVQVFAVDGADFSLDFNSVGAQSGDPGDGLNSPMAVINIAD